MNGKIRTITSLIVWKQAHEFVLRIYKVTSTFPKAERYALVDQIRRAAVFVSSNIAEGFYRRTAVDKSHYYFTSLSSMAEVQSQLVLSRDLKYLNTAEFAQLASNSVQIQKLLNGLIRTASTKGQEPKY